MPALPVVFTRRAARQVAAAAEWWSVHRLDAPGAVEDDKFRGVRRVHLARIDYHVYYRVAPRLRRVEILAFWHARRGSPPNLSRSSVPG